MTMPRDWKPFALICFAAASLSQVVVADGEIVQLGRRRSTVTPSQAPVRQPAASSAPANAISAPPAPPAAPDAPAAKVDPLLALAEQAIAKTSLRYLDADKHTPWQIIHGVLALRNEMELTRGDGRINCVQFISEAPTFRGEHWWQVTEHGGRAHPFSVPYAFEGHVNQFLALLSMSNLPLTHEFNVDGQRTVTMADMVHHAKMTVSTREEITWTLWFLLNYLDIDDEWTNAAGESWSIEKLVRIQTQAQVTNAPCGGCHGLYAIAYARNAFLRKHGRLHGVYFQAEQKINQHIELARSMQNYDGSLSSEFFKGPGHSRDFNERIKASGHMLEWLMMAMPQERLKEAWIRKAVASVATDLIHNAAKPAECGPLYHALNSLMMYRDRVKPAETPSLQQPQLADASRNTQPEGADPQASTPVTLPQTDRAPAAIAETTPPSRADSAADPSRQEQPTRGLTPSPMPALAQIPVHSSPVANDPEARIAPADEVEDDLLTIKPATPAEAFGSPLPTFSKTYSRSERLTKKAAARLADAVRESGAAGSALADDEPRRLKPTDPAEAPPRMAIEPADRTTR